MSKHYSLVFMQDKNLLRRSFSLSWKHHSACLSFNPRPSNTACKRSSSRHAFITQPKPTIWEACFSLFFHECPHFGLPEFLTIFKKTFQISALDHLNHKALSFHNMKLCMNISFLWSCLKSSGDFSEVSLLVFYNCFILFLKWKVLPCVICRGHFQSY